MTTRPLTTGITTLDTLIFGDSLYGTKLRRGFRPGEILLVRGEPGSGKTTLALQIVNNALAVHADAAVQFLTIEESTAAIRAKCEAHGFDAGSGRLSIHSKGDIDDIVAAVMEEQLRARREAELRAQVSAGIERAAASHPSGAIAGVVLAPLIGSLLAVLWSKAQEYWRAHQDHGDVAPRIVVIDSLNAFMNILLDTFPETNARLIFNTFCHELRNYWGRQGEPRVESGSETPSGAIQKPAAAPLILLTGEYHFRQAQRDFQLPESFFCDIEVVLRTEPVRVAHQHATSANVTLGYDLTALVPPDATSLEARSFCRVLKSRFSTNQARRCAYDIEAGKGLRFFETYPGDGKLLLFGENEQQKAAWDSFFNRDLPDAYPALRHEVFPLSSLQSVYESARRLQHVPPRTDMYLCTLDSYWVGWYRDYRFKRLLNEQLRTRMRAEVDSRTLRESKSDPRKPRSEPSRRACCDYPRMVNDGLRFCLLLVRFRLAATTLRHLESRLPAQDVNDGASGRQRDRIQARIDALKLDRKKCREQLFELIPSIRRKYGDSCGFLFGQQDFVRILARTAKPLDLRKTLLRPLPRSEILLYGQHDAELLAPLKREDMHQHVNDDDHWMSVPFDANVGIFVVRRDLYDRAIDELRDQPTDFDAVYERLKTRELRTLQRLQRRLREGDLDWVFARPGTSELHAFETQLEQAIEQCDPQAAQAARHGIRPTLEEEGRLTWDQAICLSVLAKKPFGVETRVFDTLMAHFLEMLWNCGGNLSVDASYQVERKSELLVPLVRALHYFTAMFDFARTEPNCTLEPVQHAKTVVGSSPVYGDWLFARYWYTTLVGALTAKSGKGRKRNHVWKPQGDGYGVEIIKMPMACDTDGPDQHHACWGEWSFALLAGSENVTLACDLVSNLMGALRVNGRAFYGAALPTVRQFYKRFSNVRCIAVDERNDIGLPSMTFGRLWETYLEPVQAAREEEKRVAGTQGVEWTPETSRYRGMSECGVFRQHIFDYRHCGREIHSVLIGLKVSDTPQEEKGEEIVNAACTIISRCEAYAERYVFVGDTFDYDVARTARDAKRRREHPRFPASLDCTIRDVRTRQECGGKIVDISLGGCCVELAAGECPRSGSIMGKSFSYVFDWKWSKDGRAGLRFFPKLDRTRMLQTIAGAT